MSFDLVLAEECPVGERKVKAAGGAINGRIVAEESGADWFTVMMTANGFGTSRSAESHAFDAERFEEVLDDCFFPGGAKEFLDDGSGDDVAGFYDDYELE